MRIAVWHNLPSGGGKRALFDQIRVLRARGHEIEVWCPPYADRAYLPLDEMVPEHIVPLSWRSYHVRLPLQKLAPQHWNIVSRIRRMDRHTRLCAQQINAGGFDVLLAHPSQHLAVTSIARFVNIPSVLYLHEPHRLLYEASPQLCWAALPSAGALWWMPGRLARRARDIVQTHARRIQAREEADNARAFTRILVNSYFTRESVLRAYGLSAHVCYPGVDAEQFTDHVLQREYMVLGVGSFTPAKNIELVIDTLACVPEPRPPLVWIGNSADSAYLSNLRAHAREVGVTLITRHQVSDEELVAAFNHAALVLYTPRLEPFGYTPIEANACGTPVVTHAEGGCRETVLNGMNGLVAESDPSALARAVVSLLSDPIYARTLGRQGRARVLENWTIEAAGAHLERHLEAVAQLTSASHPRGKGEMHGSNISSVAAGDSGW